MIGLPFLFLVIAIYDAALYVLFIHVCLYRNVLNVAEIKVCTVPTPSGSAFIMFVFPSDVEFHAFLSFSVLSLLCSFVSLT